MRGDVKVHQQAAIMLDHNKDEKTWESAVGTVKKSTETNCFE